MPTEETLTDRPSRSASRPARPRVRDAVSESQRLTNNRPRTFSAPLPATTAGEPHSGYPTASRRRTATAAGERRPSAPPRQTPVETETPGIRRGFSQSASGSKVRIVQTISRALGGLWFSLILALGVGYAATLGQLLPDYALAAYLGTLAGVRVIYPLFHRTHTLLHRYRIPRHLHELLLDELLISLAGAATVYFTQIPVPSHTVLLAVTATATLRVATFALNNRLHRKLVWWNYHTDSERFTRRVLVVGTGPRAKALTDAIIETPELDTQVVGFLGFSTTGFWRYRDLPLIGVVSQTQNFLATLQVDALIIAVESEELPRTVSVFEKAEEMGVPVYTPVEPFQSAGATSRLASLNGYPLFAYSGVSRSALATALKTIMDRVGAALALLLCLPLLAALALAIKLDSPGPVLFRQIRMGRGGRRFALYKLRTMAVDAERRKASLQHRNEMSGPVFKIKNDPRITRVGRFLRKYSLDEFPQLYNVLRGDMSLVGPRPALPTEVARFEPWQRRKLSVLPGLTCLWQIGGRNAIDFENWMKLDLQYIDTWSLWLDIKILLKTIPAVLKGSGS